MPCQDWQCQLDEIATINQNQKKLEHQKEKSRALVASIITSGIKMTYFNDGTGTVATCSTLDMTHIYIDMFSIFKHVDVVFII